MKTLKQWDAFVSHASEDKEGVVRPLTHALKGMGVRIWLDAFEMRVGDGIRQKIDEGLANSRFGLIVASPHFFAKRWASAELDALFGLVEVLPVLHNLDEQELKRLSPLLAGKHCVSTTAGIAETAAVLAERIFTPATMSSGEARDFARALASTQTADELLPAITPGLFSRCLGLRDKDAVKMGVQIGADRAEFCAGHFQESSWRLEDWTLVLMGPPNAPLFDVDGRHSRDLDDLLSRERRIRAWIRANLMEARALMPALKLDYRALVVLGRREQPGTNQASRLGDANEMLLNCRVRTYDWMLDNALSGVST